MAIYGPATRAKPGCTTTALDFSRDFTCSVNAIESRVTLVRPFPPPFLNRAKIANLHVAGASADLLVVRHEHDVTVNVPRRTGDIEVVVVM